MVAVAVNVGFGADIDRRSYHDSRATDFVINILLRRPSYSGLPFGFVWGRGGSPSGELGVPIALQPPLPRRTDATCIAAQH